MRITADELGDHFHGGANLGLILGQASGGLVDVDLDSAEAVELAQTFLPKTGMIHGRPMRRRSHWWYVVTSGGPVKRRTFGDTRGKMIVEIRGENSQTV